MATTKLCGYWSGAVMATLVVLSHCALLGTAAPAMTMGSSLGNCMTQWLSTLGLSSENISSYAAIFHWEAVTEQALHLLTLQDLELLGIEKYGHRSLIHNTLQKGATVFCENGGVCNPIAGKNSSFRCVCLDGFSGNSCENVVSCSSHVCLNGGTCTEPVGAGQIECQCSSGYSGDRCEYDPCYSSPCLNGGTCSTVSGGYNCTCPIGYSGNNCETAWLTEDDFASFKRRTSSDVRFLQSLFLRLSGTVTAMKGDIEQASKMGKGPRFFSRWATLEGSNGILHMEHFTESGNGYFTFLYSNGSINTYSLALSGNHLLLQTLTVTNAASLVVFKIGSTIYLSVAKNSTNSGSEIYQWNSNNEQFLFFSSLSTRGARDVAFISTPRQGNYLVFACHHKTARFEYPSYVYKWVAGRFEVYQYLQRVTNALSVDSVVTSTDDVLLVLTYELGNGNPSTIMYHWNGTYFDDRTEQKQVISMKSHKLFTIGVQTFLVGQSLSDSSIVHIFMYNRQSRQFTDYENIDTAGTIDAVEYFHTNTEYFLILTNFVESQESSLNGVSSNRHFDVLVYRIDGAGCELFQEIQTSFRPSVFRHFSRGECRGVVIAGSNGKAEIHRWSDIFNLCS